MRFFKWLARLFKPRILDQARRMYDNQSAQSIRLVRLHDQNTKGGTF